MFHFLVDLTQGGKLLPDAEDLLIDMSGVVIPSTYEEFAGRPVTQPQLFAPPPIRQVATATKHTQLLLAVADHLKRYRETGSDRDKAAIVDLIFGQGTVPMYQWYHVGTLSALDGDTVLALKRLFFNKERPYERGSIELEPRKGAIWLRIKKAHTRQLSVSINGQPHPLVRVEQYTKTQSLTFEFPIVEITKGS